MRTSIRQFALPALALLGIAAFLWPTLRMPYLGDDTFNAYVDGWIGYEHLSFGAALLQFFQQTGLASGRFDPIFPLIVFFNYHLIHSIVAIKILMLVAIVGNAATLYVLVRSYARGLALPSLVMLPAVFQIRFFHDPLIQFSLHLQIALEFVLLSAIALTRFGRTKRVAYATVSVALYLCAALTYEATYAFVVPLVILAIRTAHGSRERIALCVSYAAVPFLLSAIILVVRSYTPVPATSPYAVTFLPLAMLRVIALQVIGALPLSYLSANPNQSLPTFVTIWRSAPQVWIAAVAMFALTVFTLRARADVAEIRTALRVAAFACIAVIASTSMICLSPRWQAELKLGLAYIPVYFEDFGVAVILAAVASIVMKVVPFRIALVVVSGLLAVVVGTTYGVNALTLAQYTAWSSVVPRAIDAGVLRDARDGDAVFLDDSYPANTQDEGSTWNVKYFLYAHTGKRLVARHLDALPAAPGPAFILAANVPGFDSGRVAAGSLAGVSRIAGANIALIDRAELFDASPTGAERSRWVSSCGPVPIANLVANIPSGLIVAYDAAFSVPERDGTVPFRWASGLAHVIVENPTHTLRHATLRFTIRPATPAKQVTYSNGKRTVVVPWGGHDLDVVMALDVPPNATSAILVNSDNTPILDASAGRTLRFEVRDVRVGESACERVSPLVR